MTAQVWPSGWLTPRFSAPGVRAVMSARTGGHGRAPYDGCNLKPGIGDDDAVVAANRAWLAAACGAPGTLLQQVHGSAVHRIVAPSQGEPPVADAAVTCMAGLACEVQVADCLPVLFADRLGRAVGAAHAGWRGLAGGVLEATLAALQEACGAGPADLEVWLGPCIGAQRFEVGADVLEAFCAGCPADAGLFRAAPAVAGVPKWHADLAGLARARLGRAGVCQIAGNDGGAFWCTVSQPSRFFSYRRDGRTGRMAALIWRDGSAG